MKARNAGLAAAALGVIALAYGLSRGPGWHWGHGGHHGQAGDAGSMGMGMMGGRAGSMARHRQVMHEGVPEPYASLPAPSATAGQVARGAELYRTHCAACHGPNGRGDGPAAAGLSPPPADLQQLTSMPMGRRADYLAFAIGEGGVPFGTAMPAYRDVLDREQRQALVAFLRQGL